MRKGFTLLELIVVIIIIGILATLGFTQYAKTLEKGRATEAKFILGQVRSAQIAYNFEYGAFATAMSNLAVEAPTGCSSTHYFSYATGNGLPYANASRCTGSGKPPNAGSSYYILLHYNGGNFSGSTGGYY